MTNVNNGHIAQHPPVIPALPTVGIAVDLTSIAAPAANTLPQVSIQDLNEAITAADTAYVSSRKNAATAAATVFYVWTYTCSAQADRPNKDWYEAYKHPSAYKPAHDHAMPSSSFQRAQWYQPHIILRTHSGYPAQNERRYNQNVSGDHHPCVVLKRDIPLKPELPGRHKEAS